ncbi:GntR family transcriptional regulator [Vallitalea longa]|uniref:GntR family transcriptional regulator n=1 Tax=Vallitalea longa TaxID=2936439 RepID=A0A9W6DG61_9FIRM|nr:GntR family transcriptional regulator [Vallitalea longa]GKX30212.1 GntR family transcriptional regulator [Vallitalea longa]
MKSIDTPIPLYYKLKQEIIKMIENEEVNADELIPSEREMMEKYDISRTTVRKAIDILVNEGYLYKIHGKGTYVKGKKFSQGLLKLTSCKEMLRSKGFDPISKVIKYDVLTPSKRLSHQMNLTPKDKVFYTERVNLIEGSPINYTKSYIPYKYVPSIENFNFNKSSIYKTLSTVYKIDIIGSNRTVEAVLPDEVIAKALDINLNLPLLKFNGWVYGEHNSSKILIEYFKTFYRSDRSKFYIDFVE